MGAESRRSPRASIELPATYTPVGLAAIPQQSTILNVSTTGVCLTSPRHLPTGMGLVLHVDIDADCRVVLDGTVIWSRRAEGGTGCQTGLRISGGEKVHQSRFHAFCKEQLELVPPDISA
jgi:hypothetical protein